MKYLENRQKLLPDLIFLLALMAIAGIVTILYISHERYFYFWDYSNYSNQTRDLAAAFSKSSTQGIRLLRVSLGTEYNKFPCLPLVPFTLIFGNSRIVYILSCALVYIVPFSLVMGAIATKLIPTHSRAVFWSTAFLTLLLPPTWVSTLRGYPDIGGAVIIGLAILVYFKDIYLRQWWQIPLLGFLLGFSTIFRRHFAYSARAFLIALFLEGFLLFLFNQNNLKKNLKNLSYYAISMTLIALGIVVTLLVITPDFLRNILFVNYSSIYQGYKHSIIDNLIYYGQAFGWSSLVLAALGFFVSFSRRLFNYYPVSFIVIFGIISLLQWSFFSSYLGIQYATHFILFIVLGVSNFIWFVVIKLKKSKRLLAVSTIIFFLVINGIIGLTPIGKYNKVLSFLWATNNPPLVRDDYPEFSRLIERLRKLAPNREAIYIANSGDLLNHSLVRESESQLYGLDKSILNVILSPDFDTRDFYPLDGLLRSQYVVIANKSNSDQEVVKFIFDVFAENSDFKLNFKRDFKRLPEQFVFSNNVTVDIYQRISSTSLETALQTLKIIQERLPLKPFKENFWLTVSQNRRGSIFYNQHGTPNIQATFKQTPTSFLYFGSLPELVNITGILQSAKCTGFEGFSLRLSTLNSAGEIIKSQNFVYSSQPSENLSLSIEGKKASYLLLELTGEQQINTPAHCSVYIKNLEVKNAAH